MKNNVIQLYLFHFVYRVKSWIVNQKVGLFLLGKNIHLYFG